MQRNLLRINVAENKKGEYHKRGKGEGTQLLSVLDLGYRLLVRICEALDCDTSDIMEIEKEGAR